MLGGLTDYSLLLMKLSTGLEGTQNVTVDCLSHLPLPSSDICLVEDVEVVSLLIFSSCSYARAISSHLFSISNSIKVMGFF